MPRACLGCGKVIQFGSRCALCGRRQARVRNATEPWRQFYMMSGWSRVRARVIARDGYRCRAADEGERCPVVDVTGRSLEVHHTEPLEELWRRSPSGVAFAAAASDPSRLLTVCHRHHRLLEESA